MRVPLCFGFWFSAHLNKGRYSSCLNPHIGIYRPGRDGLMLRFNPDWKIWNYEFDAKIRDAKRRAALRLEPPSIRQIFVINLRVVRLQMFVERSGLRKLYARPMVGMTRCWTWKAS